MSEISTVELEHCKELAMPPGSLFELSSRFVSAKLTAQLLAVYALIQSINLIPLSVADDTVKWAKLKWWAEELSAEPAAPERHPVLRALQHSGARQQLSNDLLLRLVSDAVAQMDAFPDADSNDLIERLASTGETDIMLESALGDVAVGETLMKPMSQATGIYGVVMMLLSDYPNRIQLLPLDWLAEFGARPEDLKGRPPVAGLIGMVGRLANIGAQAYRTVFAAETEGQLSQIPKHLRLRWSLEARFLDRVARNAERHFNRKSAYGLSEVWFAWRFCHKA